MQQWAVSGGRPHLNHLLYNECLELGMGRARTVAFYTNNILNFPKTTWKSVTTTQGAPEACETSCLLAREHKSCATRYQNPEPTPTSHEPAITSTQLHQATKIQARIQIPPISCYPTSSFIPSWKTTYLVPYLRIFLSR